MRFEDIYGENPPTSVRGYHEPVISVMDPIREVTSHPVRKVRNYLLSLLPIVQWIYRYNLTWLSSDLVAGITVGVVVVPQSMSYAQIAGLPVQYGLYSSFIGVMMYCFFATSKDVTIGPVAVMSAEVYKVVHNVIEDSHGKYTEANAPMIASVLALVCGGITAGIGVLRLGFILDYISMPAVLGFMSGSAFTIVVGQVPTLMGISSLFNTRGASHMVVINTLKNLKHSTLDAAFGLVCLFLLFLFKYLFEYLSKRDPRRKKLYFYLSTMRTGVIIIFSTLISWGVCRKHNHGAKPKFPISILKSVPRGLQDVGVHPVQAGIVKDMASELPIATVVLLLEHIAIAKSFGRINDYRINPNQELIAIGVTNLIGHFFNAYPATGSFSRSALKSKCGVRTPLAGIFTGICVLIAIYALTDAFFWISKAALAAVIIHAVVDLISSWRSTWKFWRISPIECVIFLVDVFLCVFVTIEAGIYFSVAASLVLLLLRISFPSGEFLGKVEYIRINNPTILNPEGADAKSLDEKDASEQNSLDKQARVEETAVTPVQSFSQLQQPREAPKVAHPTGMKWLPLSQKSLNADIQVVPPPPGIFVYRFNESLVYPNANRTLDKMVLYIREHTKRDIDYSKPIKLGDRPWNDHGPRNRKFDPDYVDPRPFLRAVTFDFSATPHVDLTAVTALWDVRQELIKYANRDVEFHFSGILSPWVRRALIAGGFGGDLEKDQPLYQQIALTTGNVTSSEPDENKTYDIEAQGANSREHNLVPLTATNKPFFHFDIPDLS